MARDALRASGAKPEAWRGRMRSLWALLVLAGLTAGCCGPDECRPATRGFAALRPVTGALEGFVATRGRPPESLRELFGSAARIGLGLRLC